jgi:hypothetical protein
MEKRLQQSHEAAQAIGYIDRSDPRGKGRYRALSKVVREERNNAFWRSKAAMSLFIHANVRVTGPAGELAAFRDALDRLLLDEFSETEVEERHREGELVYDFKVSGGIPFPALVQASSRHPQLRLAVEWVNMQAGVKGFAAIENGQLKESRTEKLADTVGGSLISISTGEDGALLLALTFLESSPTESVGYAVTSDRDAVVRAIVHDDRAIELCASSGDQPQWEEQWVVDLDSASFEYGETAEPIDEALYLALRRHAEEFAAEWLWFDTAPAVETAIERERFRLAGYPVRGANLRYEKLRLLAQEPRRFTSEPLQLLEQVIRRCLVEDQ